MKSIALQKIDRIQNSKVYILVHRNIGVIQLYQLSNCPRIHEKLKERKNQKQFTRAVTRFCTTIT